MTRRSDTISAEPSPRGGATLEPVAVSTSIPWREPAALAAAVSAAGDEVAWLDTAAGGPTPAARGCSLVAREPIAVLEQFAGGPARMSAGGRTLATAARAWDLLRAVHARLPALPTLPSRLGPGWIGYIGFESAEQLERLPAAPPPLLGLPLVRLALFDRVVVFDHASETALSWVVPELGAALGSRSSSRVRQSEPEAPARDNTVGAARRTWPPIATTRIEPTAVSRACASGSDRMALAGAARSDQRRPQGAAPAPAGAARIDGPPAHDAEYLRRVRRALEYIAAGDIYQVNLARALVIDDLPDAFTTYMNVRAANPSRYAALLSWPGGAIASFSPELFLRVRDGRARTSPVKGTRPRTGRVIRDRAARRELLASAKEAAELAMIIDLHRNDLGRVCRPGSVRVACPRRVESLPSVIHTVADVTGRLADGATPLDLLAACFPAGSISGVPKIRALEIIRELESHARGAYTGAIGHIGLDGQMSMNVAIRTLQIEGARGVLHVGGGIVADSDPSAEFAETVAKGRGILRGLAGEGTKGLRD